MAWEAYVYATDVANLDSVSINAEAGSEVESMDEAAEAAKLAQTLMESGVVGKAEAYHVWLSGHANPKHMEIAGLPNDYVTVTVGIAAYPGHAKRYPAGPNEGD